MLRPAHKKTVIFVSALVAVFITCAVVFSTLRSSYGLALPLGSPGTTDFAVYWSAHQLFIKGENPYDKERVKAIQAELPGAESRPLLPYWNPPWSLTTLAPFMCFRFEDAAAAWFVLNMFLLAATARLYWTVLGATQQRPAYWILPALIFLPNICALSFGQLGIVMAFSVALFFWYLKHDCPILAGLALLPATLKPHTLYLFWIAVGIFILREGRWKVALSFIGGMVILLLLAWLRVPNIFKFWLAELNPIYAKAKSPTLGAMLRSIDPSSEVLTVIAMIVLPIMGIVLLSAYLLSQRKKLSWEKITPLVLCFSLVTTSYSWLHDQAVLVLVQLTLTHYALQSPPTTRWRLIALLTAVQFVAFFQSWALEGQHYFVWLPLALFFLWTFFYRSIASNPSSPGIRTSQIGLTTAVVP